MQSFHGTFKNSGTSQRGSVSTSFQISVMSSAVHSPVRALCRIAFHARSRIRTCSCRPTTTSNCSYKFLPMREMLLGGVEQYNSLLRPATGGNWCKSPDKRMLIPPNGTPASTGIISLRVLPVSSESWASRGVVSMLISSIINHTTLLKLFFRLFSISGPLFILQLSE
jgi:hypothetical protein